MRPVRDLDRHVRRLAGIEESQLTPQVRGALANGTGILEQADSIVRSVDGLMASPHWEERLPQLLQVIDRAEADAEKLTDRSFLQAVALIVIFFLVLLAYRYVSRRLIWAPGRG